MKPSHIALAVLIAAIWGFNFIAIKLGVTEVPPFFLTGLRFLLAAFPASAASCKKKVDYTGRFD